LIRKAARIATGSAEVAQAFRLRGFRRSGDDWVEAIGGDSPPDESSKTEPERFADGSEIPARGLRGLTPDEVRQRLGSRPDRVAFSGSKGQLIEQWIYVDPRQVRYVNFLHSAEELKPRAISDYSLPRSRREGQLAPPRSR
jgi:hypothetical protein